MLNLVVLAPLVALAAANPGYFNSASFNPAQEVRAYGGGPAYGPGVAPAGDPAGVPNFQGGRDVSYTRTDVVSKQVKGRTSNFDPNNILQNAVPHSVRNVHYAEENIVSGSIGSSLQESSQPEFNYRSPNIQQSQAQLPPQQTHFGGGSGLSGGSGGRFGVRFNRGRRTQAQAQAEAQALAQALQDRGFEGVQLQNLDLPDSPQGQHAIAPQPTPPASERPDPGFPERRNSYYIPALFTPHTAQADNYYNRHTYTY